MGILQAETYAAVMELADMTDSKSVASDGVWVRVPPAAPVGASLSTYPTPKNPCLPCVILQKRGGHVKCEKTKKKNHSLSTVIFSFLDR